MSSLFHSPANKNNEDTLSSPRAIIITGTLGSGKTTLLNHLLSTETQSATPGSFVVIENDVGDRNVDVSRLATDRTNVLEITAGCICCNDLHSLRAAVTQLRDQSDIKTLFIETTGIANPAAVKDLLHKLEIPTLVIVTVDVKHFDINKSLGRISDTIPHADIVALTWTRDQSGNHDRTTLDKVISQVRELNPFARVVEVDPYGQPETSLDLSTLSTLQLPKGKEFTNSILDPEANIRSLLGGDTGIFFERRDLNRAHKTFSITLPIESNITPEDVIAAITSATPNELLRAKGRIGSFEIDCTNGDWKISTGTGTRGPNFLTVIATKPLTSSDFPGLNPAIGEDIQSIDLADQLIRERAIELVTELMSCIPDQVVQGERLITETVAGEAWRYVSLSDFPEELRKQFLKSLLEFYLKQSEALESGRFNSHPALPYYQREVGYNLSWFLIDCEELVKEWNVNERITAVKPVTLYLTGLQSARDARHIGTFRQTDLPYLQRRIEIFETVEGGERQLAEDALTNCTRLCLDRSWEKVLELI